MGEGKPGRKGGGRDWDILEEEKAFLVPREKEALSHICPAGGDRQPRGHPLQMASVCLSWGWGVGRLTWGSNSLLSALQPALLHLTLSPSWDVLV